MASRSLLASLSQEVLVPAVGVRHCTHCPALPGGQVLLVLHEFSCYSTTRELSPYLAYMVCFFKTTHIYILLTQTSEEGLTTSPPTQNHPKVHTPAKRGL